MRTRLSALIILLAASAGCPTTRGYVGGITGVVVNPSSAPVDGASVYLSGGSIADPPTLNQPVNGAPPTVSAPDGSFYLQADAGSYPLVVTWIAPAGQGGGLYAAIMPVTVVGGEINALQTAVTIAPCQTGPAASNPCPPSQGSPVPTPTAVGTPGYVPNYAPDQVTITRSRSTDALHISTDSGAGAAKLDFQIPHATTGWSASAVPIDLATSNGSQVVVTYSVPANAGGATYFTYRAVSGELYLDTYDVTTAATTPGTVACHLVNALFTYPNSSGYTYTIAQTAEISGPVVVTP